MPSEGRPAPQARRALITGITGQDGYYLAKLLLDHGYQVYGLTRATSSPSAVRVEAELPGLRLTFGDLADSRSLLGAMEESQPHEVYNLAAMSIPATSWETAELTSEITGLGVLRILEAIRIWTMGAMDSVRFYQASSSEMFGAVLESPQNESTPFCPRGPYGTAKTFGHHATLNYRERYGAFAVSGILFNHESPRRGLEFVTRKISRGVARIKLGLQEEICLGNLDARRDWGFAGDYVDAMWRMLQQDSPDDYVVASGVTHSIRDILDVAFARVGIENWESYVGRDMRHYRPDEPNLLTGDSTKAREALGWKPGISFEQLIEMMVDADLAREDQSLSRAASVVAE